MFKKILLIFLFNAGLLTFLFLANTEIPSIKPLISQSQPPNSKISGIPSKETIAENVRNDAINRWRFPQSGRVVRIEATNLRTMGDIHWISATIPKWKITLESTDLRLVYITNDTGGVMVLAKRENLQLPKKLPTQVITAVQKAAVFYWNPQIETTSNPILPPQVLLEKAEPATWQNTCLDLPNSGDPCTPKTIIGWRIKVVGIPPIPCPACLPGNSWQIAPPTLNFRIDDTGKEVRADIPESVASEGFKVAQSWGLATKSGRIVGASPTRWGSGCDGVQGLPIACDPVPVSGWLLKIEDLGKRWHIQVDDSGNNGELIARENIALDSSFDKKLADEVRNLAAQHLQIGQEQILFTQVEAQSFGACLGLPTPVEKCAPDPGQGYRVTVEGKPGQRQVYRVSPNSGIRTEANNGLPPRIDKLPNPIAEKVFLDAKSRLEVALSDLRITSSEITSECFRTATDPPNAPCQVLVSGGWRIVVTNFKRQLVYRVNSRGHIESVSPE